MNMESEKREHPGMAGKGKILTIRCCSGISGDMLLAGLAYMNLAIRNYEPDSVQAGQWLNAKLGGIMPALADCARLVRKSVQHIAGWHMAVNLPHEHELRNLKDITAIIEQAQISDLAREKALAAFTLLAECEAQVHGANVQEIHFHEVGALDSILDICGACELYYALAPDKLVVSPLPLADGSLDCRHGRLAAPAPATLRLLTGMEVCAFAGDMQAGELVTPTAAALLKTLGASFGGWPCFLVEATAIAYGDRIFQNAPNGAIFALGASIRTADKCGQ